MPVDASFHQASKQRRQSVSVRPPFASASFRDPCCSTSASNINTTHRVLLAVTIDDNMSRRSEHTTKVFVGSLPANVTAEDLRQLFSPYGTIAECDIANRCGFLHLEDKDLADKAIEELNNTTFMGGRISVEKGRVKPRGERRMRGPRGGGGGGMGGGAMGGRKRDVGPYSRDGGYGPPRGGPRNGGYGQPEYDYGGGYDDYRGDYGARPTGYDDGYDRRPPPYDDRRAAPPATYRSYNNGYDRRPYEERSPYEVPRTGGYDDRRMPPVTTNTYDDRRAPMTDTRRPLIDDQSTRAPMNTYDRPPATNDMYSRRDTTQKPVTGGYDRSMQSSYGTAYGSTNQAAAYGTPATGYGVQTASYGQPQTTGYGDTRAQTGAYMDTRQQAPQMMSGYGAATSYNQPPASTGSYGDNYGVRAPTNTYDASYPPLPQQRGW